MDFKEEELIKSPLNYTGGKFKLLPKILPLFPEDIDTFVDLFAGGCNVGINVNANKVIFNDIENHVIDLMKYLQDNSYEEVVCEIEDLIKRYNLTDTNKNSYDYYNCNSSDGVGKVNKEGYTRLRKEYNKDTSNSILFFAVVIFAFCNQIRFNSKGEFNMPVNKRDFNKNIRANLLNFINKLSNKHYFFNKDFRELKIDNLSKNDLVYLDPPYLVTCASYNEQDGWNETKERELLELLDKLDEKGIRFALSNVLENKGKSNEILKEWCKKYTVNDLNHTYGNCNYHAKDKSKTSTIEVLITNY